MSKVTMLSAAYTKLLNAMSIREDSNGELVQTLDGVDRLVRVEDMPMVIPTEETIKHYSSNKVIFHPLSENILQGESPVIKELRAMMMDHLHSLILDTADALISIALDNDLVSTLTPTQIESLKCTAGADATTLKNWKSIVRRAESRGSANRVVTIFLKRGAEIKGKTYKRAAIVNFNLYNELTEGKLQVFGVKIRKTDLNIFTKVFEQIIEDVAIVDKYSEGSESLTAPYFDVLVKTYAGILKTINSITWSLRKPIKEVKGYDLHVKDDFSELFTDLMIYRDVIPPLPYNEGDRNDKREQQIANQQQTPAPQPLPDHAVNGVSKLGDVPTTYYAPNNNVTPLTNNAPQQPAKQHVSQQLGSLQDSFNAVDTPQQQNGNGLAFWQQPSYGQPAMQQQSTWFAQNQPQQNNNGYGSWWNGNGNTNRGW